MNLTIDMMKYSRIKYTWKTICVAQIYQIISSKEVEKYLYESSEIDRLICEKINNLDISNTNPDYFEEELVDNEIVVNSNYFKECELNKIKYAMLFYIKENYYCSKELPQLVADLYSDLWYPDDMKDLVYYMPSNDEKI